VLKAGFTKVTSRSVKYFGFLIAGVNGSSIDFQWADGRYKMWDVILRFAHHPSVGSENHNNLCRHLLVGNVSGRRPAFNLPQAYMFLYLFD